MKTFKQGIYHLQNPQKYINLINKQNKGLPIYRSSWELKFFKFCDLNPNVQEWCSEPLAIKYFNKFKNRESNYYPDFYMLYNNQKFLVEIKPKSQTPGVRSKSLYDSASQIINESKWQAAEDYCNRNNFKFVILDDKFFVNK